MSKQRNQPKIKVKRNGAYVVKSGSTRPGEVVPRPMGRMTPIVPTDSDKEVVRTLLRLRNA
jgi:hypothetical protein